MKLPRPKTLSDFIRPLSALDLALVCLRMKGGKMSKTALSRAIASLSGVQTDVVAVLAHSDSASPTAQPKWESSGPSSLRAGESPTQPAGCFSSKATQASARPT